MANIRIDANAAKALAEYEKIANAQAALANQQEELVRNSKEGAREEQRLARARERYLRDNETAQERYILQLATAKRALSGIDDEEEQLARTRKRLSDQYVRELEAEKRGLGEVEEASDDAFGTEGIEAFIGRLGASVASIGAVVQIIRQVRQEADEAGEALQQIAPARGRLAALAGADPVLRQQLGEAATEVFEIGTFRSREGAENLTFELQSANLLDQRKFFASLAAIDDAAALARSVGVINAGFRGTGESVGTAADIVSKSLAASSVATGVEASGIAEAVASISATARPFGLTDEELFAAVSVVSQTTGSASQAGTQINSLLSQLARRGLADQLSGQGFSAILRQAGSLTSSEQERIEFLGGSEAARAFRPLENEQVLSARIAAITQAQTSGLALRTLQNALSDPVVSSNIFKQAAENRLVTSRDEIARTETLADASQARSRRQFDEQFGPFAGAILDGFTTAVRFLPGVDENLAAEQGSTGGRETAQLLRELVAEQKRNTEQVSSAIEKQQFTIPTQ